jgi:hypothetical protein
MSEVLSEAVLGIGALQNDATGRLLRRQPNDLLFCTGLS